MTPGGSDRIYDRAYLLSAEKRNDVLSLDEIRRYGADSFGDPDYVSIYGMSPAEWYRRGARLLARTAVECTRDRLADLIGRDVAASAARAGAAGSSGTVVIDPFAGSGNTLEWIRRHVEAERAVGFELDHAMFEMTRRNLALVGAQIELLHQDFASGLGAVTVAADRRVIVFVAPPWGEALTEASGLDLRRTAPPVGEVVDLVSARFAHNRLFFAVQIYEHTDPDSIADVTARFDWSDLKTYLIDEPGRNHGALLGTRGWTHD
jgi:hypothetical protein